MKSKQRCQRRHAQKRAAERTGLNLGPKRQAEIIAMIQGGRAQFVRKDSNRITVFDVSFEQVTLRVCYDKQRKSLATVFTPEFN